MAGTDEGTVTGEARFRVVRYERMNRRETELWAGTDLREGVRLHQQELFEVPRGCDFGENVTYAQRWTSEKWQIISIKDMRAAEAPAAPVAS